MKSIIEKLIKTCLPLALADWALITFILFLVFVFDNAAINQNTLIILVLSLAISYYLLSILNSKLINTDADKEEVDKEISLFIVIGVFFLLANNPELININKAELLSKDVNFLKDFYKFLNMSLLISVELLVFSSMSYFFGFNRINKDKDEDEDISNKDAIYDINYTCEDQLTLVKPIVEDKDNKQSEKLIAPIQLLLNATKIILIFVAIIFMPIIYELEGADYIRNLAASAGGSITILAIIFREGAKSFTAGIRIHMDDLLRVGHEIKSKKLEIDGKVEEISVTNIKVRNSDHTVTNVPIDKLLSSPFYNISTRENFGRRINLIINLFIPTIKKLGPEHPIRSEALLKDYFKCKDGVKCKHCDGDCPQDKDNACDDYKNDIVNGNESKAKNSERTFTNIGSYKAYLKSYLNHHGLIQQDKNIIVRSLNKTDTFGYVPIQIKAYVLISIKDTKTFRTIESDIMDHALSKLIAFELRASQDEFETVNRRG
jgi:small-conductance mechanosensitive channel